MNVTMQQEWLDRTVDYRTQLWNQLADAVTMQQNPVVMWTQNTPADYGSWSATVPNDMYYIKMKDVYEAPPKKESFSQKLLRKYPAKEEA